MLFYCFILKKNLTYTHTTHTPTQRDGGGASQVVKKVKSVMGTDGDLRKLKLSKAKNLLRNFGVAEDEVCTCNVCMYVYMYSMYACMCA